MCGAGRVSDKEVVGVQPREVEEQRFEMQKCVWAVNNRQGLWYAFVWVLFAWGFSLFISNVGHCFLVYGNLKNTVSFKLQTYMH